MRRVTLRRTATSKDGPVIATSTLTPARAGGRASARRGARRARVLPTGAGIVAVAALGCLAVLLRRPGYLLSHSFWLDEAWVVDSVRAPFAQLGLMTSSTPIGWTVLLRLVPRIDSPERSRLLPLAFAVAAVAPAWLLGRRLAGDRRDWRAR